MGRVDSLSICPRLKKKSGNELGIAYFGFPEVSEPIVWLYSKECVGEMETLPSLEMVFCSRSSTLGYRPRSSISHMIIWYMYESL